MMGRLVSQQTAVEQILTKPFTDHVKATWRDYMEVTKPGITKSNLFATFAGYWAAVQFSSFSFMHLVFTLLGTGLLMAGGCTLNNFYDRGIDSLMERTRTRALAEGRIKPIVALWYGVMLAALGVIVLAIGVNWLSAVLGLVGFFVYVVIYTMWLKRTSTWNTIVGSISGAIPPMIGWTAVVDALDLSAWALFFILFMWQPPHFFALAMRKVEEYRAAGIPMLPVMKGFGKTKQQTLLFTILLFPSSLLLYYTGAANGFYLTMAIIFGGIYIVFALMGLYTQDDERWAKQMFFYSLLYLTVLLLSLIIDVTVTKMIVFI
jgi:heme o synthase